MKDKTTPVFEVKVKGDFASGTLIVPNFNDAMDMVKEDFKDDDSEGLVIEIRKVFKTDEELEALPEFEGW